MARAMAILASALMLTGCDFDLCGVAGRETATVVEHMQIRPGVRWPGAPMDMRTVVVTECAHGQRAFWSRDAADAAKLDRLRVGDDVVLYYFPTLAEMQHHALP